MDALSAGSAWKSTCRLPGGPHVAWVPVLAAFVFVAAAYLPPGSIKHRLKYPMLVGIVLWAVGHLLANGDLASLLLFGAFFG